MCITFFTNHQNVETILINYMLLQFEILVIPWAVSIFFFKAIAGDSRFYHIVLSYQWWRLELIVLFGLSHWQLLKINGYESNKPNQLVPSRLALESRCLCQSIKPQLLGPRKHATELASHISLAEDIRNS